MPYHITGKNLSGLTLLTIHIDSFDQDDPLITEADLLNAVKSFLLTVPGVTQTKTQKQEWVTTYI